MCRNAPLNTMFTTICLSSSDYNFVSDKSSSTAGSRTFPAQFLNALKSLGLI
jgi:hypothetical protein